MLLFAFPPIYATLQGFYLVLESVPIYFGFFSRLKLGHIAFSCIHLPRSTADNYIHQTSKRYYDIEQNLIESLLIPEADEGKLPYHLGNKVILHQVHVATASDCEWRIAESFVIYRNDLVQQDCPVWSNRLGNHEYPPA